jgi:hypothetical protein
MKYLFLIICLVLCLSCKHVLDGDCEPPVKLKNKIFFRAEGGIDNVTAEGFWLNPSIVIGDTIVRYYPYPPKYSILGDEETPYSLDYEGNISCTFMKEYYDVSHVEGSWFVIDRPDENKIIFSVSKNETGKERDFSIYLDAGDCGSSINIAQSAE